jgi:hypothetical protein
MAFGFWKESTVFLGCEYDGCLLAANCHELWPRSSGQAHYLAQPGFGVFQFPSTRARSLVGGFCGAFYPPT